MHKTPQNALKLYHIHTVIQKTAMYNHQSAPYYIHIKEFISIRAPDKKCRSNETNQRSIYSHSNLTTPLQTDSINRTAAAKTKRVQRQYLDGAAAEVAEDDLLEAVDSLANLHRRLLARRRSLSSRRRRRRRRR